MIIIMVPWFKSRLFSCSKPRLSATPTYYFPEGEIKRESPLQREQASMSHPGLAPGQAKGETGTSNSGKTLLGERSVARSVRARQMTWPRGIKWTSPSGPPVLLPQQQSCPEEKGASGHTLPLAHWEAKDIENIVPIHGELNGFKNFLYKDPRFVWRAFRWNYFAILLLQFLSAAKVSLKICRPDQGALWFQIVPLLPLAFRIKSKPSSVVLLELLIVSHLASAITSHTYPCPLQPLASPYSLNTPHSRPVHRLPVFLEYPLSPFTRMNLTSTVSLFFLSLCPYLLFIWLPFPWRKVLIFMLL